MKIIYNESIRNQKENVQQAISIAQKILSIDEFYEDITAVGTFYNAHFEYTAPVIAETLKRYVDSDIEIYVEHYWASFRQRLVKYGTTNAIVFPSNPNVIQLLGHRLFRNTTSIAETLIHEFVHCADGLDEKLQSKRVVWNYTHRGSSPAGNSFAAPNQIARIAREYFPQRGEISDLRGSMSIDMPVSLSTPQQLPKVNYVAVGKNGHYAQKGFYQYTERDLEQIISHIKSNNVTTLNIYFHGGLVTENEGADAVSRVVTFLSDENQKSTHSIGFIWKTGFKETIVENLSRVFGTGLGYIVRKIVLSALTKRLGLTKSSMLNQDFDSYIDAILSGKTSCPDFEQTNNNKLNSEDVSFIDLSEEECLSLCEQEIRVLDEDPETKKYWLDYSVDDGLSIKESVENDILNDFESVNGKSFINPFRRAYLVGKIFYRVLKRYSNGSSHGPMETIVEEIFQQFFVSDIGTSIWGAMKDKANNMWSDGNPGGDLLSKLKGFDSLKINLVGHSAGANCIAGLLDKYNSSSHKFTLDNVVLLAGASTYEVFTDSYISQKDKFNRIRLINMPDENERKDELIDDIPIISKLYPASLLYFISGVLEDPSHRFDHISDHPIIGMSRYLNRPSTYQGKHFDKVRNFVTNDESISLVEHNHIYDHGDFDNNPLTLLAVKDFIEGK